MRRQAAACVQAADLYGAYLQQLRLGVATDEPSHTAALWRLFRSHVFTARSMQQVIATLLDLRAFAENQELRVRRILSCCCVLLYLFKWF